MKNKFTKQQEAAITEQGSILVSAAAGSGKTAVLVERIVQAICRSEKPFSVDNVLVVTFTNSAAAELKVRIQRRLIEESKKQPNNRWIKRQLLILPSSKICTIDAFCIDLVRENFEALNISPDFKILDNSALLALYAKAAEQLTSNYYESNDKEFISLLNGLGSDYGDFNLINTIHNLYIYSSIMPFPNEWLDSCAEHYDLHLENVHNSFWCEKAYEIAENSINDTISLLSAAENVLQTDAEVYDAYLSNFLSYKNIIIELKSLIDKKDWNGICNSVYAFKAISKKSVKGSNENSVVQCVNFATGTAQATINKLKKIFYDKNKIVVSHLKHGGEYAQKIVELTKEYSKIVDALMRQENSFTFSNIESMAISLLCKKTDGDIVLTNEAKELTARFCEVLVDEYQDVNNLQDMLFYILSNKGRNLFIVGDIKQSIYRFRGANPNNFLEKKSSYKFYKDAQSDENKRIVLSNNFRSRKGVCDYINFFFTCLMHSNDTEIEYTSEEMLYPLAEFPENTKTDVQVHLLDFDSDELSSIDAEAIHVADYIERTINEEPFLRTKNGLRKAEYSDFCILLRATKKRQEIFANALRKRSIPVSVGIGNFTESAEVVTLMSLLRVIDNPTRDVPLLSVMMSPIFRFTAEKIAQIRIAFKYTSVYGAVCAAAKNDDAMCKEFVEKISNYRRLCTTMTAEKFISYVLDSTGYMNIVYSMSDPENRRKNCLKVLKLAREYDGFSNTGISGFINMFDRLAADDKPSQDAKVSGTGVKIMSIHGSKGLQFPICILADLEKSFNISDTTSQFCKSENFGIGVKYIDYRNNKKVTPLSHIIIGEDIKTSMISEELRLLYVAMTRAEERLVLLSNASKANKKLIDAAAMQHLEQHSENKKLNLSVKSATSYNDWLLNTLILHPSANELRKEVLGISVIPSEVDGKIEIEHFKVKDSFDEIKLISDNSVDDTTDINIDDIFAYEYPFKQLRNIQAKTSVSNLVHNKTLMSDFDFNDKPAFLSQDGFSATDKGTILHKFMELANFSDAAKDLESEIYRLVDYKFFTQQQADILDRDKISAFFNSSLYKRIELQRENVRHEMQFLCEVNANEIVADIDERIQDEKIIIQGAIDLLFEEDGEIVVVDFKTDRIFDEQKLKDLYAEQLNYYAYACEKIFKKNVKEKIIYSLNLNKEILV